MCSHKYNPYLNVCCGKNMNFIGFDQLDGRKVVESDGIHVSTNQNRSAGTKPCF